MTTETLPSPNGERTSRGTVRLVSVQLALNVVLDNGDVLEPLSLQPIQVTASAWPTFELEAQLADIQRQVDPPA